MIIDRPTFSRWTWWVPVELDVMMVESALGLGSMVATVPLPRLSREGGVR